MRVALVHDYLNEFGGAERVLLALSELYPKAPIYTIFAKKGSEAQKRFKGRKIVESWFSYLPFSYKLISPLRFLIPFIWKSFDFSKYDLVITSASWAVTKGMKNAKAEICYLHTPPRYLWGYDTSRNWKDKWYGGLISAYALIVNHVMRMYDFDQAQKVTHFIVNSENVGKRVKKFYGREYKVIYPPVEVARIHKSSIINHKSYYLTGGRLVRTKNFHLIIKACKKAKVNLKVFGSGVEEKNLPHRSGVEFLGHVSDWELARLYTSAKAFIVAQRDEDFGITPVEAASFGCPTIAYKAEGYLESVIEGSLSAGEAGTGIFFDKLNIDSIAKAIQKSQKIKWNKKIMYNHAKKFSKKRFKTEFETFIKSKF